MSRSAERTVPRIWLPLPAIVRRGLPVIGVAALMALAANLRIHLPFTPVPVTFQTLIVVFGSAWLGMRRGAAAQGLYLGLGALGAPVFAGGAAGLAVMAGPTGGYFAGFALAAVFVGRLLGGRPASLGFTTLIMGTGALMILGAGFMYLMVLGFSPTNAFALGVLPFLLWDAVKVCIAAASYRLITGSRR